LEERDFSPPHNRRINLSHQSDNVAFHKIVLRFYF
jgi:hypothetical protein